MRVRQMTPNRRIWDVGQLEGQKIRLLGEAPKEIDQIQRGANLLVLGREGQEFVFQGVQLDRAAFIDSVEGDRFHV
jgi:hypothetical protein